jgi:aminoglycoside 3-N-acetyltransferase I
MSTSPGYDVACLSPDEIAPLQALVSVFGEAFEDTQTYGARRAGPEYLRGLLASESFIAVVARKEGEVIGGLVAYELRKCEQERSEIYIYDLAVAAAHRRQGVATALIRELQRIGAGRGACVIFVQADPPDAPAIALYSGLGVREEVLHFDIPVRPR